MYKVTCILGNM
ncbi:hypothetical protein Celaphus_00016731 [Cervus elaphus hippelaphus]|uniref:Uncharacterized protein n=1 Tax=Cervus elaphus hippelaphus TaxID=46360 RepID=A0A212C4F1_CEREH|nr:hypothetical protein Celaphus_00016731 [Cervus elaphus hippelaphus]